MAKKAKKTKESSISEDKLWAILSYIFILWIFPLWVIKPRNEYAVYHAKQGLVLFIASVIISFVSAIPVLGWIIGPIASIILFVLWIIGIVNAATDKKKPVPLIGQLADKFDF